MSANAALEEALFSYVRDAQEVRQCLDAGADPSLRDRHGRTLMFAACQGHLDPQVVAMVASKLKQHPNRALVQAIANEEDVYGDTPLSTLCNATAFPAGYAQAVKSVLELGADANPLSRKDNKKLPEELYHHVDHPEAAKALGWMFAALCETAPSWEKRRSQPLRHMVAHADTQPAEFRAFLDVCMKTYMLCYGFDYQHDNPDFHRQFGRLMAACVQKDGWEKQAAAMSCYTLDYCRDTRDMLADIATRLLLPQLLLSTGFHQNEEFLRKLPTQHFIKKLLPVAAELIYQNKNAENLLGVLKNWNDRQPEFPRELSPLWATGNWHRLTRDFVIPSGVAEGMRVACLTDHHAMEKESDALKHSAENLVHDALNGHSHFYSILDVDGMPLSTFVLRRIPVGGRYEDQIRIPDDFSGTLGMLYMEQHRAHKNAQPCARAAAAFDAFKYAIEASGQFQYAPESERKNMLCVQSSYAGETNQSKARKAHIPPVLLQIGDAISPEMVEKRFAHYARAKGVAYVPQRQEFRASDTHMISGGGLLCDTDGRKYPVAFRDMSAADCFRLSGVTQGIHEAIASTYPTLAAQMVRNAPLELPREIRFK